MTTVTDDDFREWTLVSAGSPNPKGLRCLRCEQLVGEQAWFEGEDDFVMHVRCLTMEVAEELGGLH